MGKWKPTSDRVVRWFKDHVSIVLQKTEAPAALEELNKLASQVEQQEAAESPRAFPICLLGQAGVGKSTLINTLVADNDIVVPSGGGTGPLTASALRVSYGERQAFTVKYHTTEPVNPARFVLETRIQRQAKVDSPSSESVAGDDAAIDLDAEEQKRHSVRRSQRPR